MEGESQLIKKAVPATGRAVPSGLHKADKGLSINDRVRALATPRMMHPDDTITEGAQGVVVWFTKTAVAVSFDDAEHYTTCYPHEIEKVVE
jgi:hypothetical protein